MADTAVLDVDGTLVDTNCQHAQAWYRAFRRYDVVVPVWRIHRAIGMGGDQLVAAVAGDEPERTHGDDLRAAWEQDFAPMLAEVAPFAGGFSPEELRRAGAAGVYDGLEQLSADLDRTELARASAPEDR